MGSLKEFLDEKAGTMQSRLAKATATRDEWIRALDHLIGRVEGWIAEADTNRVLGVARREFPIQEEYVGTYNAPGLAIRLEPWEVRLAPIARMTLGPFDPTTSERTSRVFGQVELTNGVDRCKLFRRSNEPDGPWVIVGPDNRHVRDFDQRAFEAALRSLLE